MTTVQQPRYPGDDAMIYVDPEHLIRLGTHVTVVPLPSGAVMLRVPGQPGFLHSARGSTIAFTALRGPRAGQRIRIDSNAAIRRLAGLRSIDQRRAWWVRYVAQAEQRVLSWLLT